MIKNLFNLLFIIFAQFINVTIRIAGAVDFVYYANSVFFVVGMDVFIIAKSFQSV